MLTEGYDTGILENEVCYLRDELVYMGEVFNNDSIQDVVLDGLSEKYLQKKYSADADDDLTLDRAVITMRNMYANRAMRHRPSRKTKGRESDMVVTSAPSAVVTGSHCENPGHIFQNCFKCKGTMSGKKPPQHHEKRRGVDSIIPTATIISTVGLNSGAT